MDIIKGVLGNFARAVGLGMDIVVLLNSHVVTRHSCDPGYMACRASIALCNTPRDGCAIDANTSPASGFIPGIGISPVSAFILIRKVDAETFVDTPGDEAGTLALKVVPFVGWAATVLVWIVVGNWAGDVARTRWAPTSRALACHISVRASLDIVISDVAVVRSLIPDTVSANVSSCSLTGNGNLVALGVCLLRGIAGSWTRAAIDVVSGNRV